MSAMAGLCVRVVRVGLVRALSQVPGERATESV